MRFLSAGGLGVLLYYMVLYILTDLFGVWYVASAVIASLVNWTSNFVFQKYWTFQNKNKKSIHRQVIYYAAMAATIFVANLALLYVLVEYTHIWYLGAQVIVTVLLTVASYFVASRIFSDPTVP
jgi:dolichol-phosphate mannosyltransferase